MILASNLKSNIDEAFSRRFQSVVYFPMPTKELRLELWRRMVPPEWLGGQGEALLALAADKELSGGSITNVVRRCALKMAEAHLDLLEERILKDALAQELMKA